MQANLAVAARLHLRYTQLFAILTPLPTALAHQGNLGGQRVAERPHSKYLSVMAEAGFVERRIR